MAHDPLPPLKLPAPLLTLLHRRLEAAYPHEGCGLIVGLLDEGLVTDLVASPNLDRRRARDRYELDPAVFAATERRLRATPFDIIGIYHSHPDHPARPSQTDLDRAWPRLSYVIVSVRQGRAAEWTCWRLTEGGGGFVEQPIEILDQVAPPIAP